ncbi:hypothetical protein [Paenarthrobacter sp. PH39-S1]|uniref:hypothetical protein n=1 Tax=Paenarthrobacter sp. PH39-S1 TaxID=3046204 RepID=UPI0024BAAA29|nr:hypothetical protein [Paenarthrobacter sp. PH39-S1]MDJ0355958.1 hypothetical protein [Paenarthrobacter sp. PH39-S1]
MDIELRTIEDCPHGPQARELYRRALELEGLAAESLTVREITTNEQAAELLFHGSPTFSLNGADLLPSDAEPALTCRVYGTPGGLAGLPALSTLREAIREFSDGQSS